MNHDNDVMHIPSDGYLTKNMKIIVYRLHIKLITFMLKANIKAVLLYTCSVYNIMHALRCTCVQNLKTKLIGRFSDKFQRLGQGCILTATYIKLLL